MAEGQVKKFKKATKQTFSKGILTNNVKERLETLAENAELVVKQLKSDTMLHHASLSFHDFHQRLCTSTRAVSDSCTKLSVLFSRPPCPSLEETGILCTKVENATLNLTSTYCQINTEWGKYLSKEIEALIIAILQGVVSLGRVLMTDGCNSDSRLRLQGTGSVWESCDNVQMLSKDNKSAVLKVCLSQLRLLKDACDEVNELVENNGATEISSEELEMFLKGKLILNPLNLGGGLEPSDISSNNAIDDTLEERDTLNNGVVCEGVIASETRIIGVDQVEIKPNDLGEESCLQKDKVEEERLEDNGKEWTDEDKPLIDLCVELIKLTTTIAEKAIRVIVSQEDNKESCHIVQLDMTADMTLKLSPQVDEVASILEAPVNHKLLSSQSINLHSILTQFVDFFSDSHFCKINRDKWSEEEFKSRLHSLKLSIEQFYK